MSPNGFAQPTSWQLDGCHLAEKKATALAGLDDNVLDQLTRALDTVNALAEASAGFVWRLHDKTCNNTGIYLNDDLRQIANTYVWKSVAYF